MILQHRIIEYLSFYCPACKHQHTYSIHNDGWQFNGNMDKPTFTPSLLNRDIDIDGNTKSICHLFIVDGQIIYCDDCTHNLRGQNVPMVDL
jgi:hypothetical protein